MVNLDSNRCTGSQGEEAKAPMVELYKFQYPRRGGQAGKGKLIAKITKEEIRRHGKAKPR